MRVTSEQARTVQITSEQRRQAGGLSRRVERHTLKRDPGDTALPTTVEIYVEGRPGGAGQPSEDAFADLYNRTFSPLVAYCRRYCPPGYDPEDIAQEALSKAWSSWDRYSPSRPFWPWVATIARRLCVDYWRRDERALARSGGSIALEPCPQPRPDELSEAADECRMAVSAFRRLRPDHQRIVGLRDIEGWSYEDIARFEGVTVESIRGSLRRARLSLRKSYETLAKGGVMALVPGFARLFAEARARLALRMARWQTTLNDTGIATTRLGDAIVSLMALSVAVVGMGAPTGEFVQAGGASSDSALSVASSEASLAGAGAGDAGAAAADALGAASSGGPVSSPLEWSTGEMAPGPIGLLPGSGKSNPADATFDSFTPSPNYQTDGTIFGIGRWRVNCTVDCGVVFKSTDRGVTWQALPSQGLNSSRILLAPAYPRDPRIFATGNLGLQVSHDGGISFITLVPSAGTAAMSPAFSSGDPRFFLPDAPGLEYNTETKLPEPLSLKPGPTAVSPTYSYGFPTDYRPSAPVMYVGASVPKPTGAVSIVHRCVDGACEAGVELPGMGGAPRLTSVRHGDGEVLWAAQGTELYRSTDGAVTFTRASLPPGVVGILDEAVGPEGRLYVIGHNTTAGRAEVWFTDDLATSWQRVPDEGLPVTFALSMRPLSDGTLLVGLAGEVAGIACSHDGGRTWAPHC